jgi:hypothetical protein
MQTGCKANGIITADINYWQCGIVSIFNNFLFGKLSSYSLSFLNISGKPAEK